MLARVRLAKAEGAVGLVALAALAGACGSRPERGLWDGGFGTGKCGSGATGQLTCTPDPGSPPADCAEAEAGLELVTSGDVSGDQATCWSAYVDGSRTGRLDSFTKSWETATWPDPFPRCGASGPARALRIEGGPFYGWGGGFGSSAKDWHMQPPADLPEHLRHAVVDFSHLEGVFLWARRGPDSQGGIRVNVGDWETDDDISYLMYTHDPTLPRHCERVRECACTNHKACTRWDVSPFETAAAAGTPNLSAWAAGMKAENVQDYQIWSCMSAGSYCEDPAADIVPGYYTTSSAIARCNTCGQTRCDERYEAYPDHQVRDVKADAQFLGKPCTPFTSRSGVTSAYCFDLATETPAEPDEQCGDHFMRGIHLTTEWRLYLVPFTTLQQQGFGKRFAHFEPARVTALRLTWDGGYVDFWIGKVGFYRQKR